MSAEMLAGYAGVVLSLLFSYVPGLAPWFDGLDKKWKQLIMGMSLVVVAGVIYALGCAGISGDFGLAVTCDRKGAVELINMLMAALVANQGAYLITRK